MKKLSIAVVLLLIFVAYSLHERSEGNISVLPTKNTTQNSSSTPPSMPSTTQQTSGIYQDGSYDGTVTDAYYGNLQVKAIISNGKISDVQFLQYPSDRGESIQINNQAMPLLKQEAIQSQTAHVDIVSGATQTSQAFQQSLQSALDMAKA